MLINLDGVTAVGKTTLASYIGQTKGFHIVSETLRGLILPFSAPDNCVDFLANQRVIITAILNQYAGGFENAIFDTSILEYLIHSAVVCELKYNSDAYLEFFKTLETSEVDFGEQFFILLTCSETELYKRKDSDYSRQRKHFSQNLELFKLKQQIFNVVFQQNERMLSIDNSQISHLELLQLIDNFINIPRSGNSISLQKIMADIVSAVNQTRI